MKLQTKLILTVLIVFIISLFFVEVINFNNSKIQLRDAVFANIHSTSHALQQTIDNRLDSQERKVELIATQSDISNEEMLNMLKIDGTFYDMFLINSQGIVTASTNPERVGLYRGDRDYFINARNQTHVSPVYFALVPKMYSISVSTPFHDGVLVAVMNLNTFSGFVTDRAGLGKTGETLLAFEDEKGNIVYFGKRLYSDKTLEAFTKEQIADKPIAHAMRGETELFDNLLDYRGVEVIASTQYINRTKIGLVTKIDRSEAFASIDDLKNLVLFMGAIVAILVGIVVYLVSREVVIQIRKMTFDVERITKGELEVQLQKSGISEIQGLTDSLNRILASMKLAILRTGATKSELGLGEVIKAKESVEQRYKLLYDSAADAIMTLEPPKWNFTAGNPAAVKMFMAKSEEDFISRVPWEFSPRFQADGQISSVKAKKMIEQAMKIGSATFEWTHKRLNGKEFPARVSLVKVNDGKKEYLQATVRDLRLEEQTSRERMLASIIENSNDAIVAFALDGQILSWNNSMEKLYGYKAEDAIGKYLVNIVPKEFQKDTNLLIRKLRKGIKIEPFETTITRRDGRKVVVSISISLIKDKDGKVIGGSLMARELTERAR